MSLTKADGTSELIPGLSILPVDLQFSFNLFELNPGQKPASSWGSFNFSLPSFPHFDFSGLSLPTPSLPSFSLPNLKLSLPNLDLSKFSFPDLAALLPSIGLDLPNWSLKLPNISLPSLSLGGGGTGGGGGGGLPSIDWANLKLPNLVFQLPRLNIAGLKVDFTRLLSAIDFGALSWPEVTLPNLTLGGGVNWLNLGLSDLLLQLKGLNLPGISFTLPSAWPNGAGGTSLSGIKLPDLKLALPDIDLDWANLTLPELLLSLPRLNISRTVDRHRLRAALAGVAGCEPAEPGAVVQVEPERDGLNRRTVAEPGLGQAEPARASDQSAQAQPAGV